MTAKNKKATATRANSKLLRRATDSFLWRLHREILKEERPSRLTITPTFADLLLRRGAFFEPPQGSLKDGDMRATGQCFVNCQRIALGADDGWEPDWIYCEGWAINTRLRRGPFEHGWLVNSEGVVSDPTWRMTDNPQDFSYLGLPVNGMFLEWTAGDRGGMLGPLDWTSIPDEWTIDQMLIPVSRLKNAIRAFGSKPESEVTEAYGLSIPHWVDWFLSPQGRAFEEQHPHPGAIGSPTQPDIATFTR